jgi:hypothetical protein
LAAAADKEVNDMVKAYEDKLTAACPKDIKPGMTFKNPARQTIFEVKKGPEKATIENLQGDEALWFGGDRWKDGVKTGQCQFNLANLKKMKYLHTA